MVAEGGERRALSYALRHPGPGPSMAGFTAPHNHKTPRPMSAWEGTDPNDHDSSIPTASATQLKGRNLATEDLGWG